VCQKHCKYIKIEEFGGQKDLKKKIFGAMFLGLKNKVWGYVHF